MTALALLMVMVYAYWYQTNDRRIRHKTERYLSDLTGGRVKISKGRFSLFGGIELHSVRMYVPDADRIQPIFDAQKVIMRHHPWELLLTGRLKPTEIICIEPVVRIEYKAESKTYDAQKLLTLARRDKPSADGDRRIKLPPIRVREGRLIVIDVEGDLREVTGEIPIEMSLVPRGVDEYVITFEETDKSGKKTMQGEVFVDLAAGQITRVSTVLPLENLDKTLPRKYRRWRNRYDLAGEVHLNHTWEGEAAEKILEADLVDVSMKFPPDEGGLALVRVSGRMVFDQRGVTLESVSGRIPQAQDARIEISGRYEGYEPNAPFRITLSIREMSIPQASQTGGALEEALKSIRETYSPEGRANVSLALRRDREGKITYAGLLEPQGMSLTLKQFPYRVDHVRGRIAFTPQRIELQDLRARRGDASLVITGQVSDPERPMLHDVTVRATNVPFDDELRRAIPPGFLRVWEALAPSGRSGVTARVFRHSKDEPQSVQVQLHLDGQASIVYQRFPYQVDNLTGDVHISGRKVAIDSVRGTRGKASCVIDGKLEGVGTDESTVELRITGRDLPLDEALAHAAGPPGPAALEAVNPLGSVEQFSAHFWKVPNTPLDYRVEAKLKDVTFNVKAFPYAVNNTSGLVTIRPNLAIIEQLRGVHGDVSIATRGQVILGKEDFGVDIEVEAKGVPFDREFHDALPKDMKNLWAQLNPTGRADMTLALVRNLSHNPGKTDYRLVLDAREMGITYKDFPFPLRGITGRIVAIPGEVVLEKLTCKDGAMRGVLEGVVWPDPHEQRAELTLQTTNVPITADLLDALPDEFAELTKRFEPGGTCDVNLRRLRFRRSNSASQTQASTAIWDVAGSATVRDAAVNIGFGKKMITGSLTGFAEKTPAGLKLETNIALDKVVVGDHKVTRVSAELLKSPTSSVMMINNISGQSHGGYLAGFALVDLTDPLRYGISLSVNGIRLQELFDAQGTASDKPASKMSGLLDGRIELTETVGKVETRQAKGVMRISQGKLYKLPVMLDLLTVLFLTLPRDSNFTEGALIYHLRGEDLIFEEIHLLGPQISLVGSGTMHMKTKKLNLTFLTSPGKLPRLSGLVGEVIEGIAREIMEVRVTGTLTEPKMRTRSLRSLEEVLRQMIAPKSEE